MPQFRNESGVVEAMQFTEKSKNRVFRFVRCNCYADFIAGAPALRIETLEGEMTANLGDWVVKGVKGEFYPIKADIFEATFELVS